MTPPEHLTSWSRDALLALVAVLQHQVAALTAANEAWRADMARRTREAQRPAAPFAKGTRVATPQRPGRQPGAGPFHYREAPLPAQLTAPPVAVPVTLAACPACGGPLAEARVDVVSTTDIPASPRPHGTQYRVAVGRGRLCGKQGRGHHPAVALDQDGATAHRVGERALAAAHGWHDGIGLPGRKGPLVLEALQGRTLPQGAIPQDAIRRATGESGAVYAHWREAMPESPVVHTDDTRWRVGGAPASQMACDTDEAPVSQSRAQQRHEEVQEGMPPDYEGVLVTDRGRSSDAPACNDVKQHKGIAHLLRSIRAVVATKKGRARDVGERLKALWQDAMQLWHAWHAGEGADCATEAQPLEDARTPHLRPRIRTDPDNQRLRNGTGRHHNRGNRLRFLEDPRIAPTNNRAERVLRPAVIARKGSQCSQNTPGAQAFAACKSVVQTRAKRGVGSMVEGLSHIFRAARIQSAPP